MTGKRMIIETKMVWAKRGNKLSKKFKCSVGPRAGKTVASIAQCAAPVDMKKKITLLRTKAQKGARMVAKAKRTKRINHTSKLVRKLNK